MTVGTNTWISRDDANIYFGTRISSADWAAAADADKDKALQTAFRQIKYNTDYEIPSETSDNLKYAQCEQAVFLIKFATAISYRKGLQAQGVTAAGIVKETYSEAKLDELAICAEAKLFLKGYIAGNGAALLNLEEDETCDVDGVEKE
jgi:hypothetical protein